MSKQHDLKTWPQFFVSLLDGTKTVEIRENDRGFQVGDTLRLREWNPEDGAYTGQEVVRTVTHIVAGIPWLQPGCVAMSLRLPIVGEVTEELLRAQRLFPPFNSSHEGYAVILEEVDELWEEVKNNKRPDTLDRQRKEALQVAAMGMRYLVFVDGKKSEASHE